MGQDLHRVVTQDSFGDPEVLHVAHRRLPEPLPTEVRVRVHGAGVNPVDAKTRAGGGMAAVIGDPPFVLGWDAAGVVDAVGRGVTRFQVGDRVFGMPWFPREGAAYAEHVTAPSRHFASIPDGLDRVQAAGLPLAGLTAWQALVDTADVQRGQRVLINAAAGGVGHLAVQVAASRGAYVIGTASAPKHGLLAELGTNEPVDYHSVDIADAYRDVDVALDLVGGDEAAKCLRTVRPGGILIVAPGVVAADLVAAGTAAGVRVTGMLVEPDHVGLEALAALSAQGRLTVVVSRTFDLADASAAHRDLESGRTTGKLVLTVG